MVKGTFERRLRARLLRLARAGDVPHNIVTPLASNIAYHERAISGRPRPRLTQHRDEMESLRLALDGLLQELSKRSLTLHARAGRCPVNNDRLGELASELGALRDWADREHDATASTVRGLSTSGRLSQKSKARDRDELVVCALIKLDELGIQIVSPNPRARGGSGVARRAVDVVEAILSVSRWGTPREDPFDPEGYRRSLRAITSRAWKRAEPIIERHERAAGRDRTLRK